MEDDHTYALALDAALRKKLDFHEDSAQLSDVVKMGSSSSAQAIPNQTAAERMVLLLQKPKDERLDSDEEVFPADTIETKRRTSLSTPSMSDIPAAFVLLFFFQIKC